MKVKAKVKKGAVVVKLLAKHPMETGRRKGKDGKLIPGHYITELEGVHNGERVFQAELGPAVSKDPYLAFSFTGGNTGDTLTMSWLDNTGETKSTDVAIR